MFDVVRVARNPFDAADIETITQRCRQGNDAGVRLVRKSKKVARRVDASALMVGAIGLLNHRHDQVQVGAEYTLNRIPRYDSEAEVFICVD